MKLLCDLLTRRRSNKNKKETTKFLCSPTQSINQSIVPFYNDRTLTLFDKQNRCTCHYFNFNENSLAKKVHSKQISNNEKDIDSSSSKTKSLPTINDFCIWYDVRSTLFDLIDEVVSINENSHLIHQQKCSNILKDSPDQSNTTYQKIPRTTTSIAIQTSSENFQRRNAKVQANTITLFPIENQKFSSTKLFFN